MSYAMRAPSADVTNSVMLPPCIAHRLRVRGDIPPPAASAAVPWNETQEHSDTKSARRSGTRRRTRGSSCISDARSASCRAGLVMRRPGAVASSRDEPVDVCMDRLSTGRDLLRIGFATVLSGLLIVGATGCASDRDQAGDTTVAETRATASVADETSDPVLPDGVIGTARVTGMDGAQLALVEVISDGSDELEVRVTGLTPEPGQPREVLFAPEPLADGQRCYDAGLRVSVGSPDRPDGWAGVLHTGGFIVGDPSFLDEIVFTTAPNLATAAQPIECAADVVARGAIEWTFPPLRGDISVADDGATGGARGDVEIAQGRPVAYSVAPDDLIDEVAARFGITRDDLFYLNPTRLPSPMSETLQVGELLNLSADRR
ncbi:hypothetical protein [Agromyces bauzanensis]